MHEIPIPYLACLQENPRECTPSLSGGARAQGAAGWRVRERGENGPRGAAFSLGDKVCGAALTARWTASRGLSWGGCGIFSRLLNRPSNVGYGMWGRNGNWSFNPVISTVLSNSATAEKFVSWKDFFFLLNFSAQGWGGGTHLTVSSHHMLLWLIQG